MKHTIAVFIILVLGISNLPGQHFPARYTATQEAAVIPHLSFYLNGGFDVIPRNLEVFRGEAKLGIADAFEIGVLQWESSLDFFAVPVLMPELEIKLRILEGSRTTPGVSIAYRTSLVWKEQRLTSTYIGPIRPEYANRGLNGSRYDLSVSSGNLIISQEISSNAQLTAGVGVQELQTRSLWIFLDPAPFASNGYNARETRRELVLSGFLQGYIRLTEKVTLFGEALTLPAIYPNIDRLALNYDRVYVAGLGVRFMPLSAIALDATIHHHTAFQGIAGTQAKLGISSILDFTSLNH